MYNKSKQRGVNGAAKGSSYERNLARDFSTWWTDGNPLALHRVAGSGGRKSKSFAGGDIVPVSDRARPFPFCIEAKRVEKWSLENLIAGNPGEPLLAFMCQTVAAARLSEGSLPLLICKKNRHPALAFLSTPEFNMVIPSFTMLVASALWIRVSAPNMPAILVERYGVERLSFLCIPLSTFFSTFSREDFVQ